MAQFNVFTGIRRNRSYGIAVWTKVLTREIAANVAEDKINIASFLGTYRLDSFSNGATDGDEWAVEL